MFVSKQKRYIIQRITVIFEATGITIEQNYFISGHIQMERDAALTERKIHKKPLAFTILGYNYFLGYQIIQKRYTPIRPSTTFF